MATVFYDDPNYDYTKYWQGRDYENQAETTALAKLLSEFTGTGSVIDVGGGFGRLIPFFTQHFNDITIFDYSQKLLDEAKVRAQRTDYKDKKISTKQGDVYKLHNAVTQAYDCATMLRVSHHLEQLDQALEQINSILKPKGIFICEIANKIHFKAAILNLAKLNFNFFSHEPVSRTSQSTSFLNHHPKAVEKMFERAGFTIETTLSVSNFRMPFLKKNLPLETLKELENHLQSPLARLYFGPSIIYKLKKFK